MAVRTLLDHITEEGGIEAMRGAGDPLVRRIDMQPGAALPYFWCRCGRRVPADMMVDLEPPAVAAARVPTSVRAFAYRQRGAVDARRFACDGCWTHWVRIGLIDKHEFRAAIGAPPLPADSRNPW